MLMLGPHVAEIAHRLVDTPAGDRDRLEGTMVKTEQDHKSKKKEDRQLSRELEMSFPASDAPAATQPGSGITGPEAASSETKADKTKDKPARRS
jgi:hypothetical protein